jgi:hypothetical protein
MEEVQWQNVSSCFFRLVTRLESHKKTAMPNRPLNDSAPHAVGDGLVDAMRRETQIDSLPGHEKTEVMSDIWPRIQQINAAKRRPVGKSYGQRESR